MKVASVPIRVSRRRLPGRRPAPIQPLEQDFHIAIADVLRWFCRPDWRWSHFPAGELRSKSVGAKLKRMGTKAGWPDLVLISPAGVLHGLELKRKGESLSDAQEAFRAWAISHGVPYSVAHSVKEALAVLEAWGCLKGSFSTDHVAVRRAEGAA